MAEDESERRSSESSDRPSPSSGDEAAQVVREVLEDQAERKARQRDATKTKPRKRLLPLPLVALFWGAACLVVWVGTPEFLLPEPLPEPSPARIEAGLRMEMLTLVTEINQYRAETGRVPESLDRVTEEPAAYLRYAPLPPDSYRLTGSRGEAEIVYQSGTPIEEFRGNARQVIQSQMGSGS